MPVFQDNAEAIGRTPLVRINRLAKDHDVTLLAKIEGRNPELQREVPHRGGHDLGRREDRPAETRHEGRRTDERQHGHRTRLCLCRERVSARADHAGEHVDRTADDAQIVRGGADSHAGRRRHGGRDQQSRRNWPSSPTTSCRSSSTTPPTPPFTGRRPDRKSGTTPTATSTFSSSASAPAGRSPASLNTGSRTKASNCIRSPSNRPPVPSSPAARKARTRFRDLVPASSRRTSTRRSSTKSSR